MIFGENLLALLVLALGGALAVGNLMALVRPRTPQPDDESDERLERPPLGRSLAMIAFGTIAAVWAIASLATADDTDEGEQVDAVIQATDQLIADH